MSYFGGSLSARGDPGFFGSLFSGIKKVGKAFVGATPLGAAIGAISEIKGGTDVPTTFVRPVGRVPTVPGPLQLTGGGTGRGVALVRRPDGTVVRRRRRMNAGNAKALRRAIRRTDAFVTLSKSALKNTGFKIVSKSAGKMTEAAWKKRQHHSK